MTISLDDRRADERTTPRVALALLESLRSTDTPAEVLEDEDLQQSLPRRLGLSSAVESQIRRYRQLASSKAELRAAELADLLTLVARRPDAADVFAEAGRRLARQRLDGRRVRRRLAGIPLPEAIRRRLAFRVARAVADDANPGAGLRTERSPLALVVERSLPAAAGTPDACHLVRAALAESLAAHGIGREEGEDERAGAAHPLCETRGDECCLWRAGG